MGAILTPRSQKIVLRIAVIFPTAVIFILALLLFDYRVSEHPVTERIRLSSSGIKLVPSPAGGKKNDGKNKQDDLPAASREQRTHAAASNATLGFSRILAIHMAHRWDKWDATMIQAYTSGLNIEYFPAVDGNEDIEKPGRIGLPPNGGGGTSNAMAACYRSHANVSSILTRFAHPSACDAP